MLSSGEMCLLLPNIQSNFGMVMNLSSLRYFNNNVKDRTRCVPRCLFDTDKLNNNDTKSIITNAEYAEKQLEEQLQIDRERFLNRYAFDILNSHDSRVISEEEDEDDSCLSKSTNSDLESRIRLDENVNEIKDANLSFEMRATPNTSFSSPEHITSDEERDLETTFESSATSPTKSKASSDIRRHPYNTSKKQTHLTDFWRIKRRPTTLVSMTTTEKEKRAKSISPNRLPRKLQL